MRKGAGEVVSEACVCFARDRWTRSGEVMQRAETLVGRRPSKGGRSGGSEGALRKSEQRARMLLGSNRGKRWRIESRGARHGNRPSAAASR